jgi:endonuclease YncB( thermonuclease family)
MACAAFWIFPTAARGGEDDEIIGAKKGKVFHTHPDECAAAKKISDENKVKFESEKEARDQGRRLCKICLDLDKKGDLNSRVADRDKNKKPRRKSGEPFKPDNNSLLHHEQATVKNVFSNTTLVLEGGQKVCLWGVAVPAPGQSNHKEAMSLLEQRVKGETVEYAWDGSTVAPSCDRFGRLRAYVLLDDLQKDVGMELISQGLAWVDRDTECGRSNVYLQFEEKAWQEWRGVWARLGGAAGKRDVLIGRGGWQYHPLNCEHKQLLTAPSTATINEAKARRLSPCDHFKSSGGD